VTIDLDDVEAIHPNDPGDMLGAIAAMPQHVRTGFAAGNEAPGLPQADGVTAIVFAGMGGSAIAGDVLRTLARDRLTVPVDVNRGPVLPVFCGPHTLVVCSSYSGNTAETLAAYADAHERGARIVAITSGGELATRAAADGQGVVRVPGGFVPRAAFGLIAFATLGAVGAVGLLPPSASDVAQAADELERLMIALGPGVPRADNPAKELAWNLGDRQPVIWGADGWAATAAARWKGQFNENAKVLAWCSAMPELDHNEVEGWAARQGDGSFVIALRHEGEHADVAMRFEPSLAIARDAGAITDQVWAAGSSELSRFLSLVAMGDLTSTYHAIGRGVDPTPMDAITRLKAYLAGSVGS
jgi:glucose/mannose-6-phosphate isomerase